MGQQEKTSYKGMNTNYIEGNTVKRMEAVPDYKGDEVHRELKRKQEQDRVTEERERKARIAARKNQQKALQMNPGYVAFLTLAMAAMVSACTVYLYLQSEISTRMKNIASLESQVLDLKTDNDAVLKKIDTSINLESIRLAAVNELGMVYPSKEQLVYFEVADNDYMIQHEDIPKK